MSSLLGYLDLEEELLTTTRFTWHSALMRASTNSCIQGTKVEAVGPLWIYFPILLT
jgi:hypothetical protein